MRESPSASVKCLSAALMNCRGSAASARRTGRTGEGSVARRFGAGFTMDPYFVLRRGGKGWQLRDANSGRSVAACEPSKWSKPVASAS